MWNTCKGLNFTVREAKQTNVFVPSTEVRGLRPTEPVICRAVEMDGSMVKSACALAKNLGFLPSTHNGGSQLSTTSGPKGQQACPWCTVHTGKIFKHIKIKINKAKNGNTLAPEELPNSMETDTNNDDMKSASL